MTKIKNVTIKVRNFGRYVVEITSPLGRNGVKRRKIRINQLN